MTKIDIYSGFLGAGKTTLIKKMISEGYKGEKLVLIENEFGEIGIDGGFLQEAGINITEMNSGCICCSLVGDFGRALEQVIGEYHPDRVIIEPSGVGKLSDVIGAVEKVTSDDVVLGSTVAVVDANKVKVYMKNFGEFYNNQVETASCIVLSRTDSVPQKKLDTAVEMLKEHNPNATVVTTPWGELTGEQLKEAMEGGATIAKIIAELKAAQHHHEHDEHCTCGCHDHDHEHHHHHDHDHHDHDMSTSTIIMIMSIITIMTTNIITTITMSIAPVAATIITTIMQTKSSLPGAPRPIRSSQWTLCAVVWKNWIRALTAWCFGLRASWQPRTAPGSILTLFPVR